MMKASGFKVIIAGGGVAGLALATMLEKFNIDYVVLEAYKKIECPGGAGIGLMPNGCFLLDQLGLYDAVRAAAQDGEVKNSYIRSSGGAPLITLKHMMYHQEKRHGYSMLFFDRREFLKVLYEQIQYRDRIHLEKRVQRIEQSSKGVTVYTQDGTVYQGDVLIGADGVHSKVRAEMKRLADISVPAYFPPGEDDKVPCYFKCSYGIAQHVSGWLEGEQGFTVGDGKSFLVVSGPAQRLYWFLFVKLPATKRGKDIPKYTSKDEIAFVEEHKDLKIKENLTFGQVYAKKLSSVLTPLHEMVYEKWFFERILLIGDSAHKPNPIGGMGANAAIETAAEFSNALLDMKHSRADGLNDLPTESVKAIFQKVQDARHARATQTIVASHELQALNAYEQPLLSTLVWRLLMPIAGNHNFFRELSNGIVGASRLKHLDLPKRSRLIPYTHELPAKPMNPTLKRIFWAIFSAAMVGVILTANSAMNITPDELQSWGTIEPIKRVWTGEATSDGILNLLTSLISFPVVDAGLAARLHLVYFLTHMLSPMLIWTVEGYRLGRTGSLMSLPVVFMAGMQLQGICKFAPLWALLSAAQSEQSPVDRSIRATTARALLPALVLGFLVPTALMFGPTPDRSRWQDWVMLFQLTPPLVSVLIMVFDHTMRLWDRFTKPTPKDSDKHPEWYSTADVPVLKTAYAVAAVVQATVHLVSVAYAVTHPDLSLSAVFFNLPHPFRLDWNLPLAETVFAILRYDLLLTHVAVALHNLYNVWELRGQGYISSAHALRAAALVVLGQVAVGSGATWAILWSWREDVITSVSVVHNNAE